MYAGVVASSISGSAPPLEKQFYVGGPNSLRGWRALGLGPGGAGVDGVNVRGDIRMEALWSQDSKCCACVRSF